MHSISLSDATLEVNNFPPKQQRSPSRKPDPTTSTLVGRDVIPKDGRSLLIAGAAITSMAICVARASPCCEMRTICSPCIRLGDGHVSIVEDSHVARCGGSSSLGKSHRYSDL
eukprot:583172-Hanusia_phi.AAC.1